MNATHAINATRAMIDNGRAHQRSSPGDCTDTARASTMVPSVGTNHSRRLSPTSVPLVSSPAIWPGSPARSTALIDDSGVAPLAAICSPNGTEPTAAIRSSSAKLSKPSGSPRSPLTRVVVSSPLVLRFIDIWLNGGPMLLSRLVASTSDENSWRNVIVTPPSGRVVGPSMVHPAATMSAVASSSASVGTAATTSASAVATSVIVPVPSAPTVMSTSRSMRQPANTMAQTHRARTRRITVTSMADGGRQVQDRSRPW